MRVSLPKKLGLFPDKAGVFCNKMEQVLIKKHKYTV